MSALSPFQPQLNRFLDDRKANVAITFAFAVLPLMILSGAAVDYGRALKVKSMLQTALDSAALQAVSTSSATASANFLANATTNGVTISGGAATFVTNSDGGVTATVGASVPTGLLSLIGVNSINLNLTSTAILTHPATPQSITFQFRYAKGWYYKVIRLWVKPSATASAVAVGTWTYRVTNTSMVAIPKSTVPYFPTSGVSDTGVGVVSTAWNTTAATSIGATVNTASNNIVFNTPYYDLYLTMDVANQQCPLNQYYYATANKIPSDANQSFYNSVYSSSGTIYENVGCSTSAVQGSSTLSSYSKTISTNSATYSQYLFINGVEQPSNTKIGLLSAFPCYAANAGQSVATEYEWEDSNTTASGTRDYFFSLTATCSTDKWSNAPSIPKLVR